ncbi:MAG: SprT family zinc-dependent metalloprotease [Candidatus Neomarinimicrobiota bacterium]
MKANGTYRLQLSNREIPIELQYGFRKRLTLTVYPDRRVVARIPYGLSTRKVEAYFHNKSKWLIKHLDHFEQHPPESEKTYSEGEEFAYLGNKVKLKLTTGATRIALRGEDLIVRVKDPSDKDLIARVIDRWYRKKAIEVLSPRYHEMLDRLKYLELPETSLRFYKMKRRWGSCSAKGVVTLNTELIKKAPESIDYVILHELCHLKVPAHNKAFYDLLESVLPDWKTRREKLNGR